MKKGYWAYLILISLLIFGSKVSFAQSDLVIGGFEVNDQFIYRVSYQNTFDSDRNYKGKVGIELSTVDPDIIFIRCILLNNDQTYFRILDTSRTIGHLPLGTDNPLNSVPSIIDIISNLFIVPINWSINNQLYIDSSYEYEESVDIEYTAESDFTFHNLYFYKGLFRETCILTHDFKSEIPAEDFTVETEKVDGRSKTVYAREDGFMIKHEVNLVGADTGNTLNLKIKLIDTNFRISSTSSWNYLSITSSVIIGPYVIGAVYGGSYAGLIGLSIRRKERKELKKNLEIETKTEEEIKQKEEEILKIKEKLPKEYDFVEQCPFCLEDVPVTKKTCPRCGGKR